MKNFILIFACSLITLSVLGQEHETPLSDESKALDRMETFKKFPGGTHGVYFGIGGGYGNFDGLNFSTINGRIAYVIDQKFEIGFAGQSFQSFSSISLNDGTNGSVGGGVGGIHLKAIYFGRKKVHVSTPLFLGAGAIALVSHFTDNFFEDFDPDLEGASPIFVAEPGVNVEFNISKVLGFEVGAKYRFSHQISTVASRIDNMDGLMLGATLKIGFFDFGGRNKKQRIRQMKEDFSQDEKGYKSY